MKIVPRGVPSSARAERVEIERVQRCDGLRLDRVEHGSAARHRAGMPMLELAPGDEHERIFLVGALVGGNDVGGNELAAAVFGREILGEHDRLSRIVLGPARVSHG